MAWKRVPFSLALRVRPFVRLGLTALIGLGLWALTWATLGRAATPAPPARPSVRSSAPAAATWSDFAPTGWIAQRPFSVQVRVSDSRGLNPGTASYRTSTSGGASWSLWGTSNLAVTAESSTTVRLRVDGLTLPDSADQNRIQFRIETADAVPLVSEGYVLAVDTTPPGSPFGLQSDPSGWTNRNSFRETWLNPADTSGIAGAYYRLNREPTSPTDGTYVPSVNQINGLTVPGEGAHTLFLWLVDVAGNVDHRTRNVHLSAFRYDATPPAVNVGLVGPLGNNGWYTGTVTASFAAADNLSGVQAWGWELDGSQRGNTSPLLIAGDLVHSLVVTATDVAGNSATPQTIAVPVDATPPSLSYAVSGQQTSSGWYTRPLTVTFSLADALAGPDRVLWRLNNQSWTVGSRVVVSADGNHTLAAYGLDRAGNRSSTVSLSLPLDQAPPTTTAAVTPSPAPSGYYQQPTTVQLTPRDLTSGVGATWMRVNRGPWQARTRTTLSQDGRYRVDYLSVDVAGNREITRTLALTLDVTPPAAPIAPTVDPNAWSANNSFTLRWENPADFSGIAGAYVHLGSTAPQPGSGVWYPAADPFAPRGQISGLAAPREGEWPVWLWLVDGAGHMGTPQQVGTLRYDATAPQITLEVEGVHGNGDWFVSPVTATLRIADVGSGPRFLRYRLNGSPWQQRNEPSVSLRVAAAGKHVLEYFGEDWAGSIGGPFLSTLRIDPTPPDSPLAVAVEPAGWSNANRFTVTWRNPLDTSGVATAYLSLRPPSHNRDGQATPAGALSYQLQAPGEGVYDLYLWLEDAAGNVDRSTAAVVRSAVRYDVTPPVTTLRFSSQPSAAGWFGGSVGVTFVASDNLSGVAATVWQLDNRPPSTESWVLVEGDGTHTLTVYSVDHAGNVEEARRHLVRIDSQPPTASLNPLPLYSASTIFNVEWSGTDAPPAHDASLGFTPGSSGVVAYNVQVRRNSSGFWEPWLNETGRTSASFDGQRGHQYIFRVQAIDAAGNVSSWAPGYNGGAPIFVDPIENGSFSTVNFSGWQTTPDLGMSIVLDEELYPGQATPVGRLGWQGWEACSDPGDLPTPQCRDTWSGIAQTIRVPTLQELPEPQLTVWYRIRSYDVITTSLPSLIRLCDPQASFLWVDTFDVTVQPVGAAAPQVLLREGNRLRPDFSVPNPAIPLRDLGWQRAVFDMRPFAGQTVRLELSNHNRLDGRFNTWTDVYGVRLSGPRRSLFLPLVASAEARQPAAPEICYPLGPPSKAVQTPLPSTSPVAVPEDAAR